MKTAGVFLVIIVGGIAYYHYVYAPEKVRETGKMEYVLPSSLPVFDTTAQIRRVLTTLHSGQPVLVTGSFGDWAQILLTHGETGWVPESELLDSHLFDQAQALLKQEQRAPIQAKGHMNTLANVHLKPSRAAMIVGQFSPGQPVDFYNRRLVPRSLPSAASQSSAVRQVWYLVRGGDRAGWVLGDFVSLDIPPGLAQYAQGINMVAWMPLDTVDDGSEQVPQYVAADRIGPGTFDFNHLRVFTWWIKRHKYVTAYVESGLDGYFPITVTHLGSVPYFRLRLLDDQGDRYQKVYGLFDTIVRPMGTVEGWTSNAMPASSRSQEERVRASRAVVR